MAQEVDVSRVDTPRNEGNEIPLGGRTSMYRFFEMLPALISLTLIALLVIFPLYIPELTVPYVVLVISIMIFRAARGAVDMSRGYRKLRQAERIDWLSRFNDLSNPAKSLARIKDETLIRLDPDLRESDREAIAEHRNYLRRMVESPLAYPKPDNIKHAVIVAAYNEPFEVIAPTIKSLMASKFDLSQMLVFFAYEERGGVEIAETANILKARYGSHFGAFELVCHPRDLPNEIAGKGSNITYAGYHLAEYVAARGIDPSDVIVTTLDCDNKPHDNYFASVAYKYVVNTDRKHASFQPLSLFLGNLWEAPAPTRVVAAGNSLWNLISSVRSFSRRNFASHSQPLDALIEMDFWSKRTIVEDGHQYWRSYFHFDGDYKVVPIEVPIYQDAVTAGDFKSTMVAQFKQLSRWSYGASDVPYVAVRVFSLHRRVPFWPSFGRFLSLLESHVTLAVLSVMFTVGPWVPKPFVDPGYSYKIYESVRDLPAAVAPIQQLMLLGVIVSALLTWRMLPKRPPHVPWHRSIGMVAQWLLIPITGLLFNSATAFYSQLRLFFGAYREKFDVTVKEAPQVQTVTSQIVVLGATGDTRQ